MKLFAPILIVAAAAGCATVGKPIDPEILARIETGKTTEADVFLWLGQPEVVTTLEDGTRQLEYIYAFTSVTPETFVPYYGLFAGGQNWRTNSVVIETKDGVVTGKTSSESAFTAKMGLSGPRITPRPTAEGQAGDARETAAAETSVEAPEAPAAPSSARKEPVYARPPSWPRRKW